MEAPNVYFDQHTAQYVHERRNEDDIEYVHKDAFIEKAKNWLYLQLNEINMKGEDMENFLNDFRKYMKGVMV